MTKKKRRVRGQQTHQLKTMEFGPRRFRVRVGFNRRGERIALAIGAGKVTERELQHLLRQHLPVLADDYFTELARKMRVAPKR